ncbi:hypothetical protein Cocul_02054 [Corynebacterium oculi]|uniref:Uncharacterized protein n=1 Tax=Corynebacterium oculi TaxID=1544416 RepID=A0A0N8VZ71_9CORY|nr:hypothetical protein Cocul_02054 [Corynebacterium oculi]
MALSNKRSRRESSGLYSSVIAGYIRDGISWLIDLW